MPSCECDKLVLDEERVRAWLRRCDELIDQHAEELTELDAAIGDADHGANMRRGFHAVAQMLDTESSLSPSEAFKKVAMLLISKVGGTSGPLYGTFFLRLATSCTGKEALDLASFTAGVEAGIAGIVQRGKAQAGEKTMLDAWYPALEALKAASDLGSAAAASAQAAAAGRDATEPMLATKGRASYLGERSVGHIDPGASSTALILQALADSLGVAK